MVMVAKSEWQYIDEKVYGIVAQIATHCTHYSLCEQHLVEILEVFQQLYEMLRQCQDEEKVMPRMRSHGTEMRIIQLLNLASEFNFISIGISFFFFSKLED